LVLTESQLAALEKAKSDKEAHGEFESECPGYCGAQDTFYVGNMKGVGRIYQQTFIDTYAEVGPSPSSMTPAKARSSVSVGPAASGFGQWRRGEIRRWLRSDP
jgi:hypothetical protein